MSKLNQSNILNMRTALITGASRGIGAELTRLLTSSGWRVFATCRSPTEELIAINLNGGSVISGIDVTSNEGIALIVEGVKGIKLDLLINNAGYLGTESFDSLDADSIRLQFETNSLSPLLITSALVKNENLISGSKVTMMSSIAASMASQTSGGIYGYRMSKAALNMASVLLTHDLKPLGISVLIVHPGAVDTDMLDKLIARRGVMPNIITTAESAVGLLKLVEQTSMETTGKFYHVDGSEMPW